MVDATDAEKRAEALLVYECAKSSEFSVYLFVIIHVLKKTDSLSKSVQRNNQNITNALRLVRSTKLSLQILRDSGWELIKNQAIEFCKSNDINVPPLDQDWVARG